MTNQHQLITNFSEGPLYLKLIMVGGILVFLMMVFIFVMPVLAMLFWKPRPKDELYDPTRDAGWVGGVIGGIANRINFSPTVLRFIFIISIFPLGGIPIILYCVAWLYLEKKEAA